MDKRYFQWNQHSSLRRNLGWTELSSIDVSKSRRVGGSSWVESKQHKNEFMQPISISSPQTLRERSILYTRRIACFSFGGSAACMVPTLLTASLSLQAASALFRVTSNAPDGNVILPLKPSPCGLISALRSLATMFTPASIGRISAVFLFAAGVHVGFFRAVDLDLDLPLLMLQLACFACCWELGISHALQWTRPTFT